MSLSVHGAAAVLILSAGDLAAEALGRIQVGSVLLCGLAGTIALTALMSSAQGLHLTRMSLPLMLGSIFTPDRKRAMVIGSILHFVNGWVLAALYVLVMEFLRHATWWLGAILGLLHGVFILSFLLPVLPAVHPRMASPRQGPTPTRRLQPPGFLALYYGKATPISTLLAHVVYGVTLGVLYPLKGG